MDARRIEYLPLDDIVPAARNPKRHATDGLIASISRFGYATPALRDERTGRLVVGHGRTEAVRQIRDAGEDPPSGVRVGDDGRWLVPVVCGWASRSDAEAEAYLVADNRHTELGGWDHQELADLLADVQAVDPDLIDVTGWDLADPDELLADQVTELPAALGDPDRVPEVPAEPVSQPGDLWMLGKHRVLCGDSTDPDNWDVVLDGRRPKVVFTDPPYGIGYTAMRGGSAIANDATPTEALQVTQDALALLHDAEAHFVCCDWRSLGTIIDAMTGAAIEPKACIVWDKESRVQNLDRYAKQHEFIVYSGPYGGQPTQGTDVWRHPRDFDPDHPTPKPVSLIVQALATSSNPGDLVADAFGGSGSTLIAAHQTGRVARLVELDPKYVDVICRRYQEHTGDKPVLAATGQPHDFTQ